MIPRIAWRRRSRDSARKELASYRQSSPAIPRLFHQIWIGPDPLPLEFEAYRASWRAHHPEWEFRLWEEDNLPGDLRTAAVYERERRPVERADILRLELLWKYGGVYVDIDMECLRPLGRARRRRGLLRDGDQAGADHEHGDRGRPAPSDPRTELCAN